MTHVTFLVLKMHGITLLFPVKKNMLTTATMVYSIRTGHVNSGKEHANVVTLVVVPRTVYYYRDNIVVKIICPYYCDNSFSQVFKYAVN